MTKRWIIGSLVVLTLGCGGAPPAYHEPAPAPRRMTVWLDRTGLDVPTAERLSLAGVAAMESFETELAAAERRWEPAPRRSYGPRSCPATCSATAGTTAS